MKLLYVADPMCSWCYAFGKTVSALLADPREAAPLQFALVMGGLRPYTTEPLSAGRADELYGHWEHVQHITGLPFTPMAQSAMHSAGFVYDTEPASRATVAVRTHWPQHVWRYFKAVQHAFYAEGRNVTQAPVLAEIAEQQGLPRSDFERAFGSPTLHEATRQDFAQVQAWGVRGFPALLADVGGELHVIAQGYLDEPALRERLASLPR